MIGNDWDEKLNIIWNSEGFKRFYHIVENEYNNKIIFPPKDHIFEALKLTSYANTKVVIVGQDPYHGEGEAHGLSFSVMDGVKIPPSLQNIYKELYNDLGIIPKKTGNLSGWAKEGVLLLNSILTVEKDKPLSHKKYNWETFTDAIIKKINEKETPVVFILWGNYAKSKAKLITNKNHLVLTSSHPSPFSCNYGFFGSKPFSKTNNFLISKKISPVDFHLD